MSTYKVEIEFKHIEHARNWVVKWREYACGGDTLSGILDQVEATFPRDPQIGDWVVVNRKGQRVYYGQVAEILTEWFILSVSTVDAPVAVNRMDKTWTMVIR